MVFHGIHVTTIKRTTVRYPADHVTWGDVDTNVVINQVPFISATNTK